MAKNGLLLNMALSVSECTPLLPPAQGCIHTSGFCANEDMAGAFFCADICTVTIEFYLRS